MKEKLSSSRSTVCTNSHQINYATIEKKTSCEYLAVKCVGDVVKFIKHLFFVSLTWFIFLDSPSVWSRNIPTEIRLTKPNIKSRVWLRRKIRRKKNQVKPNFSSEKWYRMILIRLCTMKLIIFLSLCIFSWSVWLN